MLRRTSIGYPVTTKQKTFAASEREDLDNNVNAFLGQLSNKGKVIGFKLSHGATMSAASSYGFIHKEYTTTVVWQEYAE